MGKDLEGRVVDGYIRSTAVSFGRPELGAQRQAIRQYAAAQGLQLRIVMADVGSSIEEEGMVALRRIPRAVAKRGMVLLGWHPIRSRYGVALLARLAKRGVEIRFVLPYGTAEPYEGSAAQLMHRIVRLYDYDKRVRPRSARSRRAQQRQAGRALSSRKPK